MPHRITGSRIVALLLPLLLLPAVVRAAAAAEEGSRPPADLRVMSFNIRYDTPKDAANAWPLRKELLFRTIEAFDPDLIGLQEVLPTQGEEIKHRFAAHEFIGIPRNDGKASGEMVPVLFRRDRFDKVREGHFWLSPTPDVIGSKGWDAALPRLVTWVELRDRRHDDRPILLLNTHFDHLGHTARLESAKLLRRRIEQLIGNRTDADAPAVIVTGDFNAPQGSRPYNELLAGGDGEQAPLRLVDTFAEAHPQPTTRNYTFHGFTGQNPVASRIDWVLRSDHFKTLAASIDQTNENGRYPSDHFPVTAVLRWK